MNFKTTLDQFSGKLSFVKIMGGVLRADTEFAIDRDGKKTKAGKFFVAMGKKMIDTDELVAGDIGVMAKISGAHTNDTLHAPDSYVHFRPLALPQPVYTLAISAGSKKDEDKLNEQLVRVTEEDKTFTVTFDPETHETVIAGMGELHINTILNKIKTSQKIEIETRPPRVAYRETITKSTEMSHRHKKQTGGHGQFGEVHIRVRPIERGEQYSFVNEIKGGSVSKGYIPGIEKGLHEAMEHGVLAGYPVCDVGIALFDGKEHPVDSSEMAFKIASRGALQEAMKKCGPTLLEPVMKLAVFIEEQYLGDVLSDLSSKRGRVLGQDQLGGGIIEIDALVPQAELLRYAPPTSITRSPEGRTTARRSCAPSPAPSVQRLFEAATAGEGQIPHKHSSEICWRSSPSAFVLHSPASLSPCTDIPPESATGQPSRENPVLPGGACGVVSLAMDRERRDGYR